MLFTTYNIADMTASHTPCCEFVSSSPTFEPEIHAIMANSVGSREGHVPQGCKPHPVLEDPLYSMSSKGIYFCQTNSARFSELEQQNLMNTSIAKALPAAIYTTSYSHHVPCALLLGE